MMILCRSVPRSHPSTKFASILSAAKQCRSFSDKSFEASNLAVEESGTLGTIEYKMQLKDKRQSKPLSFWHHIPLIASNNGNTTLFHYVNEIPLNTNLKMEINTKLANNPIMQDVKKGKPRTFSYGMIPFNYGCLPQTWEDPSKLDNDTGCNGDNDPVDVVEIGSQIKMGAIARVKILGSYALIDDNETDWKIIAIREDDPLASQLNDIGDLKKKFPEKLEAIHHWFKFYKTTDGKPENRFGLDDKPTDKAHALRVITETHKYWQELTKNAERAKQHGGLWVPASTREDSDT